MPCGCQAVVRSCGVPSKEILNSTCGLLEMLKLIQMFTVMIRITVLDNTGGFPKYAFNLRVSVYNPLLEQDVLHCTPAPAKK